MKSELRAVSEAVLAVTAHLSVREVLATIVSSARRLVGARYAALGVPDEDGGFAQFLADGITDQEWAAIGPLPRQHGILGMMLRDPHPVRLTDIRSHPQFGWWPPAHPVLTDFLGMPILDGDEIIGELFLANKMDAGGFTADDEELLRLLAAHAAIALVNARLYERSRELSILEERNRIARELHDSVSQKLFSLRLTADATAALLDQDVGRAADQVEAVRRLAAEASDELRAIMVGLRPADLDGDGLAMALRKQVDLLDRVHGTRVEFRDDRSAQAPARLPGHREEAAYRIAQEAMHNALRHSQASTIRVCLSDRDGTVVLTVADDGVGFDPDAAQATAQRRLGLASMRERARAVSARLLVESRPGAGTTVRLELHNDG